MLISISKNILGIVMDMIQNETFSLRNGSGFGKNVIIISADMSSSAHDYNKKIYFDSW